MTLEGIPCSACLRPLPAELWTGVEGQRCPFCGATVLVRAFPAIAQSQTASLPQALAADLEASCFYHTQSRAHALCDECGRFLCSLCMLEIPGRTLCPVCFAANLHGRKIQDLESNRTMHDSVALALAIFPAFLFWPILVTAPLTLFWIARHWNSPRSILPRTRVRFYFAGLIALSQIGFIVVVIAAILRVRR